MKRTSLKNLVEFIVRRTFAEMGKPVDSEVEVESESDLVIHNLQLDDGRTISARVQMSGERENSGIGSYEFWGQKGYDRGSDYWVLSDWSVTGAWDENDAPIDLQNPASKPIIDAINSEVESHREQIESQVNMR